MTSHESFAVLEAGQPALLTGQPSRLRFCNFQQFLKWPASRYRWGRHGPLSATVVTLPLELAVVVALPELRRRPGLLPIDADSFETLHVAENIQAPGDVLRGQAEIFQRHVPQRAKVGDARVVNPQHRQRCALEV